MANSQDTNERLAQPEPDFYGYASRLAVAIWEQHYKDVAPQWKPLDDLIGVMTQIDNMTAGLTRLAQPEQEPVAWADMDVRGEDKGLSWTPGHFHKTPLYTTPPQRKHNNGVIAERQRIVNLLMIQHEAAKGAHNYWHVAAQLIQADVASDT